MLTGCFEISTGGGWGREVWSELGWQMMIFTHVVLFSEILITGNQELGSGQNDQKQDLAHLPRQYWVKVTLEADISYFAGHKILNDSIKTIRYSHVNYRIMRSHFEAILQKDGREAKVYKLYAV